MPMRTSTSGSYQRTALCTGLAFSRLTISSLSRNMVPPSSVDQAQFGGEDDDGRQGSLLGKRMIRVVEPSAFLKARIGKVPVVAAQGAEVRRHRHRQRCVGSGHLHVVEAVYPGYRPQTGALRPGHLGRARGATEVEHWQVESVEGCRVLGQEGAAYPRRQVPHCGGDVELLHAANAVFAELDTRRQKKLGVAGDCQGSLLQTRARKIGSRLIGDLRAANRPRPGKDPAHPRPDGWMPDQQRQNIGCAFAVADHEDVAGRHSAERGYYLPVDVTAFALVEGAQQVGDVGLAAACGVRIGTQHPHAETLLDTRQLLFEIAYGQEAIEQTWTGHKRGFFDPRQRRFGLLVAPRGLSLSRQKILGNPLPRTPPIPEPPPALL